MYPEFWQTIQLTLLLAVLTTAILFVVSLPLAMLFAFRKFRLKSLLEVIITLPLVLPPSVIGYYLLIAFSKEFWLGRLLDGIFGISLNFTFEGILIGSLFYSLPFMVHPLISGLKSVPLSMIQASYTLGKGPFATLVNVILPNMKSSVLSAIVLCFAHTMGEFGVILMIGGNIPGETRVASIAIYNEVEEMNYPSADAYSVILVLISLSLLMLMYTYNSRKKIWK